jgi:ribosomal protein S18 acetylase RimI-like enzyme
VSSFQGARAVGRRGCRLSRARRHLGLGGGRGRRAGRIRLPYVLLRIDGATSVFLYELDVDERFRRRSLGRALVDEARKLGEQAGALKMWVDTSYDNEAAKRTYAAAGGEPSTEPTLVYGWRFR